MHNHKDERTILERQREVTPWVGEVQLHKEDDTAHGVHTHFLGSPYQQLEILPEEEADELFEGETWADRAGQKNLKLSGELGWGKYLDQIYVLLTGTGSEFLSSVLANSMPVHSREFAYLVSDWQDAFNKKPENKNRPKIKVNGILDVGTWEAMKVVLNITPLAKPVSEAWLETAVRENMRLSKELKWDKYLHLIQFLLTNNVPHPIFSSKMPSVSSPEFGRLVLDWQEKNKKDPLRVTVLGTDGILGLNTWSVMQWYLGLHKLYNKHLNLAAAKKAINNNTKIIKRLSEEKSGEESKMDFVFRYFDHINIAKGGSLNPEYFAYAIADFQSKIMKIQRPNGILDDTTWRKFELAIRDIYKDYEVRFNVNKISEFADRFDKAFSKLESRMGTILDNIGENVNIQLEVNGKDKSLSESINFFVAKVTIIALSTAVPGGPLVTTAAAFIGFAGEEAVDYGEGRIDEQRKQDAKREEKVVRLTLFNLIKKIKLQYWNKSTQKIIEDKFKDKIEDAKESGVKPDDVIESIRLDLITFEKFVNSPDQIEQTALKGFITALGVHMNLIVKYNNQKGIEYWSYTDVSNVSNAAKLFILFTGGRYTGVEQFKMDESIKKIIQSVWNTFPKYHKYLIYNHHNTVPVFFRINHYEGIVPIPADCLTLILKTPVAEWTRINEIWQPPKPSSYRSKIRFMEVGKTTFVDSSNLVPSSTVLMHGDYTIFEVDKGAINKAGVPYSDIILDIVNSTMLKFNSQPASTSLIDRELDYAHYNTELDNPDRDNILYEYDEVDNFPKIKIIDSAFFSSDVSNSKVLKNVSRFSGSGLSFLQFSHKIESRVDVSYIRQRIDQYSQSHPGRPYNLASPDKPTIDAVFTEALHQFQIANYFDPKEHDGILGASTLDTLGFKDHKLRPKLNSSNFYGQKQLNGIKSQVAQATNSEFTAVNWFQYIVRPAYLGHKIKDGIHLLLWRKLQQAEAWLLAQPQYQGMTPVELGRALGLDRPDVRYSGARLSSEKQAMHGFGLAIDIDKAGNPWIGAGWIQYDKEKLKERTRMLQTLKKASSETLEGRNVFEYLDSIARIAGHDTREAYRILAQRNREFIEYLQNNPAELRYWKNSASFSNRDPLKGFLTLHPDLVYALREVAGLAWGAIDFGPRASGDIMHFDLRTQGVGKVIAQHISGYIPKYGHPTLANNTDQEFMYESYEEYTDFEEQEWEHHEAIEEAEWEDTPMEDYEMDDEFQ